MTIKKYSQEGIDYLKIEGFEDEYIEHIFSTRKGWKQEDIFSSMAQMLKIKDENIYRCKQVHGKKVIVLDGQTREDVSSLEADGFLTNIRGIVLSTYHADCTPVYFYDPVKKVIGVLHAGWKGTLANIVKEMIDAMLKVYDSDLRDIKVAIGPAICSKCYEVKEDVYSSFRQIYGDEVLEFNQDMTFLDTAKANEINALTCGILEKNIYKADFCTACNNEVLYSYRKENKTKNRMITGIILRPSK